MFYIADRPDCGPDCGPGCDCGKYTELGNDVFMQYEKHHDGHLTPLKQKNVDTGWGLERILAFLNGTKDVYQTDLFAPIIAYIEKTSGVKYEQDEKLTKSMRILADHIRTSIMLIDLKTFLLRQKGDTGVIRTESGSFEVEETVKIAGGRIGHIGKVVSGTIKWRQRARSRRISLRTEPWLRSSSHPRCS